MQIKQTKEETLKREFVVKMTAEEIETRVETRLKEVGETVNLPGFRKGKVPLKVLKTKYGQAVMGEVLEKAVNETSMQAINENKLKPAMQPQIEVTSFEDGKGLEYKMSVELLPEVKLMDFKKIKVEKLVAEPEAKSVEESLAKVADSQKTSEPLKTKRASKTGDILVIDFDGTVDGKAFPGMKGEGHELELGSNSFIDTFEEQLTGAKEGDHVSVKVTFPTPYASAELAGKDAVFAVDVKEIKKSVPAKLDDEFAKKLGFDDLAALKKMIEDQMKSEYDNVSKMHLKRILLDELDANHKFEAPAGMVKAEFDAIMHQVKGHDENHVHDENCNHGADHDDIDEDEYQAIAERRVRLGLVLGEVGQENKIEVGQQELQQAVIQEAQKYPGQEAQVFEYYQKTPKALEMLRAPVFENKVIDFILEIVHIDSRTVSIEELQKASEEEPSKPKKAAAKKKSPSKAKAKKSDDTAKKSSTKK